MRPLGGSHGTLILLVDQRRVESRALGYSELQKDHLLDRNTTLEYYTICFNDMIEHVGTYQFNPTLSRDDRKFRYTVLIGVLEAQLNGSVIRGRFSENLAERGGEPGRRLVAEFVNWPDDPESVLNFITMYGPLDAPAAANTTFALNLHDFSDAQEDLREMWRNRDQLPEWKLTEGRMLFHEGSVTYVAPTLRSFLRFDLLTCPPERLKICKRVGCRHPYFIAGDLKRRFCSVECAEEGRREIKRIWWQNHIRKLVVGQEDAPKGSVENGTQKAR
jgi:hypothetical protein